MAEQTPGSLVLFPKTLDYYQIQLTKMLETERYGDAKALLSFLLQCEGGAERYHTEWQALLGWLEAAFPHAAPVSEWEGDLDEEVGEDEQTEEDWARKHAAHRSGQDESYIPGLLATLRETSDPEQQQLVIGQLVHLDHPGIEEALREWLAAGPHHAIVQFKALQALRKLGASGMASVWRDGELMQLDISATPLSFANFPPGIVTVLERVRQAAEVSDPTLSYFAEEMWKECVEAAYGTPIYRSMSEDDDSSADVWGAALHQILIEKLHGKIFDEPVREQYGITDELRFRYEQSLRWLRNYASQPGPAND